MTNYGKQVPANGACSRWPCAPEAPLAQNLSQRRCGPPTRTLSAANARQQRHNVDPIGGGGECRINEQHGHPRHKYDI